MELEDIFDEDVNNFVVKTSVVEADSSVVNSVRFKDVDCIVEVVIIVIVESAGSLAVDKEAIKIEVIFGDGRLIEDVSNGDW